MTKAKSFILITILIAFLLSLSGCALLSGLSSPEELSIESEKLPEWMLIAYWAEDDSRFERNSLIDEDSDRGIAEETVQPASGTTAPAQQPAAAEDDIMADVQKRAQEIIWDMYKDDIEQDMQDMLDQLEAEAKKDNHDIDSDDWKRTPDWF